MTHVAETTRAPAPHQQTRPEEQPGKRDSSLGVHRLAAFSDGIFAIAATLLVFQLKVPSLAATHSTAQLAAALWRERASFFSYGLSFAVIAVFWFGHHRAFRHIHHHDQPLARWNTSYLATIAVLPFTSALLGRYSTNPLAVALYAATLAASLLLAAGLWSHACRARLVSPALPARFSHWILARNLTCAAIFTASAATAVITVTGAQALWALAGAASIGIGNAYRDVRRI